MAKGVGRGGGGDYSREGIISNISIKGAGGDYSRGRRLIEGRLIFEEIRYTSLSLLLTVLVLS